MHDQEWRKDYVSELHRSIENEIGLFCSVPCESVSMGECVCRNIFHQRINDLKTSHLVFDDFPATKGRKGGESSIDGLGRMASGPKHPGYRGVVSHEYSSKSEAFRSAFLGEDIFKEVNPQTINNDCRQL